MSLALLMTSIVVLGSAAAAMLMRNLVHCALAGAVALAGIAVVFLQLHAEFLAWAQILVYVGAVAVLIVFAILMTRGGESGSERVLGARWFAGAAVAVVVTGGMLVMVVASPLSRKPVGSGPSQGMLEIGRELMGRHVVALEVVGVLLTAALIAAVVLALQDGGEAGDKRKN